MEKRIEILETTIYRLVGDDALMVLQDSEVDLADEELEELVEYLENKFQIYDWYEQMKEVLWNYFDERKVKDTSGKVVKL